MRINVNFTLANVKFTLLITKLFLSFSVFIEQYTHSVHFTPKIIFCVGWTLFFLFLALNLLP